MSTGTTAAIAAASRRAERRLVERLRGAGATGAKTAVPLPAADLSRLESRRLARLQSRGAVLEPDPGRYYLDEAAYAAYCGGRRIRVTATIGALIAIGAIAWLVHLAR